MERTWSGWSRGAYPHGVLCGILMTAWGLLVRDWDAPVPLIAVILCAPYYVFSGFLTARRRGVEPGIVSAAATAATGHVIVFLAAVIYSATTDPWPKPLAWATLGAAFLLPAAVLGALCGLAGATIARSTRSALP